MSQLENLKPAVIGKVIKEIHGLNNNTVPGLKSVKVNEEDVSVITAVMEGPENTPYENGIFEVRLVLGSDYPQSAPKGYFLTKIFHPNVSKTGEICVNTLKKDWKSDIGFAQVFQTIRCLLIAPFAESALNEDAGKLLLEDYESFSKHARLMTEVHAAPKGKGKTEETGVNDDPSSSTANPEKDDKKKTADTKKKNLKRL